MLRLVLPLVGLLAFAVADRGALEIRSLPGATVIWEGIELGVTDADGLLTIGDIPPGSYRVALRKEGFQPLELEVEVGAGTTTLSGDLKPLERPPAAPAAAQTARPPAAETRPPRLPEPEPEKTVAGADDPPAVTSQNVPAPPEQASAGAAPSLLVWALVAVAAALGAAVVRRRLQRAPHSPPLRPAAGWGGSGPPEGEPGEPDPSFLSELRQREMELAESELPADDDDVIDVEVIELDDGD